MYQAIMRSSIRLILLRVDSALIQIYLFQMINTLSLPLITWNWVMLFSEGVAKWGVVRLYAKLDCYVEPAV